MENLKQHISEISTEGKLSFICLFIAGLLCSISLVLEIVMLAPFIVIFFLISFILALKSAGEI